MALINFLGKKESNDKHSVHSDTESKYFIFLDNKVNKILQIDTYGSKKRKIPGKVSQSIQLSSVAINQLKEILNKEF